MPKNHLKRELDRYYKEIRHYMPYSSKQSSKFLHDLCCSIDEYISMHPSPQIQDILSEFGSPEEIAAYSFTNLEPESLKKKLTLKRYVLIGVASILLMFILVYVAAYIRGKDATALYETTNIDIIETYVDSPAE